MRKILKHGIAALALVACAGMAQAESWSIDTAHSTVGFKVRHFFAKQVGEFNEFEGVIHYDAEKPSNSSVEATIQVGSIDTDNEQRDNHLLSPDFFDAEKYPTISFKSSSVESKGEEFIVTGDLTIRGVTKTVSFPAEFLGSGEDGWGGVRSGFSAELKVNRKDFGVLWNKDLDKGGTMLGDMVSISLEIEAVLQQEG